MSMHYYETNHNIARSFLPVWFRCPGNIIYAKYTFVVHTNCPKSNGRAARIHFRGFSFRGEKRASTSSRKRFQRGIITWRNNFAALGAWWTTRGRDTRQIETRSPSCRRAVKIYTPLEHGCCIPRPLGMHTRSGVTKYKFRPLLGPLFTTTTCPHLSILSGIKSPRIPFPLPEHFRFFLTTLLSVTEPFLSPRIHNSFFPHVIV